MFRAITKIFELFLRWRVPKVFDFWDAIGILELAGLAPRLSALRNARQIFKKAWMRSRGTLRKFDYVV